MKIDLPAQQRGEPERPVGEARRRAEERQPAVLRALPTVAGQGAVGEHAGEAAGVEPAAQRQHRVEAAERDRVQLGVGRDRRQRRR